MRSNSRILLLIILLQAIFTNAVQAQQAIVKETNDSAGIAARQLKQDMAALDRALLIKDSVALEKLLSDEVEIKHSNGWVQTKEHVLEDFRDSTLSYSNIEALKINSIEYRFNIADVQRIIRVKGKFKEYDFEMKLAVYEEWEYKNGQWQLWNRRSVKVE